MQFSRKLALLAAILLLCGLQPVQAAPQLLADNQSAALESYAWYASRGAGMQSDGNYTLQGMNAYSHVTITNYLKPGEKYELTGKISTTTPGKTLIGIAAYDKNWVILNDITSAPTAALSPFHIDITLPQNAANVVVHITGDRRTATSTTVSVMQLQKVMDTAKLRYAPPTLVNPITIQLGTGETKNILNANQDYIVKFPSTKKVGTTWLEGGRNIVIIGGYVTLPKTADLSNNAISRALYIKNNNGIVHVEGLLVDGSGGGMSDGIDTASPNTTLQVENVRIEGIYGFHDEFHADIIQPYGGVKDLRIDKLTGYSAYQGLTLGRDLGNIGSVEISRTNLVSTGTQIWSDPKHGIDHDNGGFLIWLTPVDNCAAAYPVTFSDVYVQPRSVRTLGQSVWPANTDPQCPSVTNADGTVSFPGLPVTGSVHNGMPTDGDYVPTGVAGLNYVSPGYQH